MSDKAKQLHFSLQVRLEIEGETGKQERTLDMIEGQPFTIGRHAKDLALSDQKLSRTHLLLEVALGKLFAKDQGSRNGSYRNGKKISVCELSEGDQIKLGKHRISVLSISPTVVEMDPPSISISRFMAENPVEHLKDKAEDYLQYPFLDGDRLEPKRLFSFYWQCLSHWREIWLSLPLYIGTRSSIKVLGVSSLLLASIFLLRGRFEVGLFTSLWLGVAVGCSSFLGLLMQRTFAWRGTFESFLSFEIYRVLFLLPPMVLMTLTPWTGFVLSLLVVGWSCYGFWRLHAPKASMFAVACLCTGALYLPLLLFSF